MTPFLDGAMHYALADIPGFPVVPRDKKPLTEHGCKDATTVVEQIFQWREQYPDANVGLRTGIFHDVLDVDPDGLDTLSELAGGDDAIVPCGPVVRTPRGGAHLWFLPIGLGNKAGFVRGCDWRGRDGYALAPPSVGANGMPYEWHVENGETFDLDRPLVPVPGWLRALLEPPRSHLERESRPSFSRMSRPGDNRGRQYALGALRNRAAELARTPEGRRNPELFKAAARCAELGCSDTEIESVLTAAGQRAGLGVTETRRTIRSGITRGRANGR
jgi:hypothetical protein